MEYEVLTARFSFLVEVFPIFLQAFSRRNFRFFEKNLREFGKVCFSSGPESIAYHLNWGTAWTLWTTVWFDGNIGSQRTSILDLRPKFIKKYFSSTSVYTYKDFLSSWTNNESELGFVLHIAWSNSRELSRVRSVVHRWSGHGTLQT